MTMYLEQFGPALANAMKSPAGKVDKTHYQALINGFTSTLRLLTLGQIQYATIHACSDKNALELTISADLGPRYLYLEGSCELINDLKNASWIFKVIGNSLKLMQVYEHQYKECEAWLKTTFSLEQAFNHLENTHSNIANNPTSRVSDPIYHNNFYFNSLEPTIQIPPIGERHEPWSLILDSCYSSKYDTITPINTVKYLGVCKDTRLVGLCKEQLIITYQGQVELPPTHDLLAMISTS